jgi:hypothetical protein
MIDIDATAETDDTPDFADDAEIESAGKALLDINPSYYPQLWTTYCC